MKTKIIKTKGYIEMLSDVALYFHIKRKQWECWPESENLSDSDYQECRRAIVCKSERAFRRRLKKAPHNVLFILYSKDCCICGKGNLKIK